MIGSVGRQRGTRGEATIARAISLTPIACPSLNFLVSRAGVGFPLSDACVQLAINSGLVHLFLSPIVQSSIVAPEVPPSGAVLDARQAAVAFVTIANRLPLQSSLLPWHVWIAALR